MTNEEELHQLGELRKYCRMMSVDEDADVEMWREYERALSRAIYHLKTLYADIEEKVIGNDAEVISCKTCVNYHTYCDDPEPYEGKTGHISGWDWCEFYYKKEKKSECTAKDGFCSVIEDNTCCADCQIPKFCEKRCIKWKGDECRFRKVVESSELPSKDNVELSVN